MLQQGAQAETLQGGRLGQLLQQGRLTGVGQVPGQLVQGLPALLLQQIQVSQGGLPGWPGLLTRTAGEIAGPGG